MSARPKMLLLVAVLWGVAVPLSPGFAEEGEPAAALTLQQAVEKTRNANPRHEAARLKVEIAEAKARQASFRPNPEFHAEYEEFGWDRPWFDGAETTLAIEQALPLTDRLQAAVRAEQAMGVVAAREADVILEEAVYSVRVSFIRALAARERGQVAVQAVEIAKASLELVRHRVDAGDAAPAEVYWFEAELERAGMAVDEAAAEMSVALAELAANWGGNPDDVESISGELGASAGPPPLDSLVARLSDTPFVRRWEARAGGAAARKELEEARAVPDLTLGAGLRGIEGFSENAFVFSVSMPLPFMDGNQGAIDEAGAERRRAAFFARVVEAELVAKLAATHRELVGLWSRLERLKQRVAPATEVAFEAVRTGFENGKLKAADLLVARRQVVEVKALLVETEERYRIAAARLDYLVGRQSGDDNEVEQ